MLLPPVAGLTWRPVSHPLLTGADSRGSFLDTTTTPATMYHATPTGIFKWPDGQPENITTVRGKAWVMTLPFAQSKHACFLTPPCCPAVANFFIGVLCAVQVVSGSIQSFAAGRDASGLTLSYVDIDIAFCSQVRDGAEAIEVRLCLPSPVLVCTFGQQRFRVSFTLCCVSCCYATRQPRGMKATTIRQLAAKLHIGASACIAGHVCCALEQC